MAPFRVMAVIEVRTDGRGPCLRTGIRCRMRPWRFPGVGRSALCREGWFRITVRCPPHWKISFGRRRPCLLGLCGRRGQRRKAPGWRQPRWRTHSRAVYAEAIVGSAKYAVQRQVREERSPDAVCHDASPHCALDPVAFRKEAGDASYRGRDATDRSGPWRALNRSADDPLRNRPRIYNPRMVNPRPNGATHEHCTVPTQLGGRL